MTSPLLQLTSHIAGKNATVRVFPDRVEWEQAGKPRAALAVVTGGMSALAPGLRRKGGSTEMVPMKAITSVTTRKDGLRNWAVTIIAPGNTVEMRVSKDEAEQLKRTILAHM